MAGQSTFLVELEETASVLVSSSFDICGHIYIFLFVCSQPCATFASVISYQEFSCGIR